VDTIAAWKLHLADLVVVVLGIMISFNLNEWNNRRSDAQEKRNLLQTVYENVQADTAYINKEITVLRSIYKYNRRLALSPGVYDSMPVDSLIQAVYSLQNFSGFNGHNVGFTELSYSGKMSLIDNQKLKASIISFYTNSYDGLKNWNSIDRYVVLEMIIPNHMQHMPSPTFYQEDTTLFDSVQWRKDAMAHIKTETFRNLAFSALVIKKSNIKLFEDFLKDAEALLKELEAELK
jgi:hypothetical protein